jgi:hypothetical protein
VYFLVYKGSLSFFNSFAITERERESYYKNWLTRLWKLRSSTAYTLERQRAGGLTLTPLVQKPENHELQCSRIGKEKTAIQAQEKEQTDLFSIFLFCLDPQGIRWCLPRLVRAMVFTQSADSNANLFQKHLHRYTGA